MICQTKYGKVAWLCIWLANLVFVQKEITIFKTSSRENANLANACFYLRAEKDDNKVILEDKDLEVIGSPNCVLYDDTTIIVQHIETGYWMSYKVI
jgi:hypothetical protein